MLFQIAMDLHHERYAESLRQAAQVLGSNARLAGFLGVEDQQLERWMGCVECPPLWVLVQTLDLIADAPYAPQQSVGVAPVRNDRRTKPKANPA